MHQKLKRRLAYESPIDLPPIQEESLRNMSPYRTPHFTPIWNRHSPCHLRQLVMRTECQVLSTWTQFPLNMQGTTMTQRVHSKPPICCHWDIKNEGKPRDGRVLHENSMWDNTHVVQNMFYAGLQQASINSASVTGPATSFLHSLADLVPVTSPH